MDDEDSKTRRNLVVASMLILLAGWLRAPLDGLSESLFKVKPTGPDFAWRVWVAAGVMLAYLGLRFRFSQDNKDAIDQLKSEYHDVEKRVLKRWFSQELSRFVRRGRASSLETDGLELLVERRAELLDHTESEGNKPKIARIRVNSVDRAPIGSPAQPPSLELVIVKFNLWFSAENARAFSAAEGMAFGLSAWRRFWVRCQAIVWLCIYSRGSTGIVVPWTVATFAFAAVIYKVIRHW